MGQEQYHSGLLERDGTPDAGYFDAEQATSDFNHLATARPPEPDAGTDGTNVGSVALLHDYDNLWALSIEPNTPEFDYWRHLETYYTALRERSVSVDVIPPTNDLSAYDAVVAPTVYLANTDLANRLTAYVEAGGELLVTIRSGMKDPYNKLHDAPQPGPLQETVGATVDDHESVPEQLASTVEYNGQQYSGRIWNEWLSPTEDGVTTVGRYVGGPTDGSAAVTRNDLGDGSATYVGTWPESAFAGALVEDLLGRADVSTTEPLPAQVRLGRHDGLTWLANFGSVAVTADAPADAEWYVGGPTVDAYDVAVTDAPPTSLSVDD